MNKEIKFKKSTSVIVFVKSYFQQDNHYQFLEPIHHFLDNSKSFRMNLQVHNSTNSGDAPVKNGLKVKNKQKSVKPHREFNNKTPTINEQSTNPFRDVFAEQELSQALQKAASSVLTHEEVSQHNNKHVAKIDSGTSIRKLNDSLRNYNSAINLVNNDIHIKNTKYKIKTEIIDPKIKDVQTYTNSRYKVEIDNYLTNKQMLKNRFNKRFARVTATEDKSNRFEGSDLIKTRVKQEDNYDQSIDDLKFINKLETTLHEKTIQNKSSKSCNKKESQYYITSAIPDNTILNVSLNVSKSCNTNNYNPQMKYIQQESTHHFNHKETEPQIFSYKRNMTPANNENEDFINNLTQAFHNLENKFY